MVFNSVTPLRHDARTSGFETLGSSDVRADTLVSHGLESRKSPNASAPRRNFEAIHQTAP